MKKKSIWIIDDDSIFKIIVQKIISKSDLFESVKTYSNGEQAAIDLKLALSLAQNLPDIILLDIEMPIMDGWEFMSEIQKLKLNTKEKNIKIFMSSSSIATEDKQKANNDPNIFGYLTKPITIDNLSEIAS